MTSNQQEDYTAPVQLESLLEVPVKLILIEDLIREKSALAQLDSDSELLSKDKEGGKKCLFNCCATPSRWRDTDCYSNNSQFRTAAITLPWHDTLAVIPVMQVDKPKNIMNRSSSVNEDTDTDIEMENMNSDDEKNPKTVSPDAISLSLATSLQNQSESGKNNNKGDNDSENVSNIPTKRNDSQNKQHESISQTTSREVEPFTQATASTAAPSCSSVVLGKVTEKPTRFKDFIITHSSNSTSNSNNNSCNTIAPRKELYPQKNVIRDTDRQTSSESNNSGDDTLKLTFYNDGRKETTKEFRTATESEAGFASTNEVRYFENHGLQMSRVIREHDGEEGEGKTRLHQQSVSVEGGDIASKDNDNTQTTCRISDNSSTSNAKSSNNSTNTSAAGISSKITQSQQLRLTSSIIQNISNNKNSSSSSKADDDTVDKDNNSNSHITSPKQGKHWEGLQISRCQREVNCVTLDGESGNENVSSRETTSESTNNMCNPPEDKGESENSIERHLQTYLTSLKYVKPPESINDKSANQDAESGNKRSPVISPQSRHPPTSIISPVVSPHISSPASRYGTVANVVRMPNIQRVSPSQQASSLDSWPERTIARIPTRPFLRRNSTYELQQQQHHQQQQSSRSAHPSNAQQIPRLSPMTAPIMSSSIAAAAGSVAVVPQESPPKRFKTANLPPTNPVLNQYQQPQPHQHQYQQETNALNRMSSTSLMSQNSHRGSNNAHASQLPQQQHSKIPTMHQQPQIQAFNNLQHYNQRTTPVQQAASDRATTNAIKSPHYSPTASQLYGHQVQQHQYPAKYQTPTPPSESQQYNDQKLQLQRHLQQSLLIATTAMVASPDPVDNAYKERLRRYCEFYHRQELDVTKLQEYYQKYGFYPWDILTARDESIIRQMKNQGQDPGAIGLHLRQLQPEQQSIVDAHQSDSSGIHAYTANAARYDMNRRMDVEGGGLQHGQRQLPVKAGNPVNSPNRPVHDFSASHQQAVMQAPIIPSTAQGRITTGKANASPPMLSSQAAALSHQNRYSQNTQQSHHREYALQQQRGSNRYYQSEQHHNYQNYSHEYQQQSTRAAESRGNLPANYDIQHSPHYRNAYTQLAAATAAVSNATGSQLRSSEGRPSNAVHSTRDGRVGHSLHAQSSLGSRPVVMTVSDPVPAPPDAVPLSIHRQALEQAIKNNQAMANFGAGNTFEGIEANRDVNYKWDQRQSPSSLSPHSLPHQSRLGHPAVLGKSRTDDSAAVIGGVPVMSSQNKEQLKVASSPTLGHQTSVIRRIQQHESSPSTDSSFTAGASHNRFISDRPGISYRRISGRTSVDSPVGEDGQPTAFLYQQHKHAANAYAFTQYQQHHRRHLDNSNTISQLPSAEPVHGGIIPNENGQGIPRVPQKRRIIITDNNGVNQTHTERCPGMISSPIPLLNRQQEVPVNMSPPIARIPINEELPEDDGRTDSIGSGGGSWQYDHVVLLDKRIKTYMCKRCFETLKTEQQIRNHLFCKMLANHVQCHVCLQLVNSDTYPAHLQIHGIRPNLELLVNSKE